MKIKYLGNLKIKIKIPFLENIGQKDTLYKVKSNGKIGKLVSTFDEYIVLFFDAITKCEVFNLEEVEQYEDKKENDVIIDNSLLQPIQQNTVVNITDQFQENCKDLDLLTKIDDIKMYIKLNKPDASLGKGLYKIRYKDSESMKGQSGAYRVIYYYKSKDGCYLLNIFSKSEKENLTDKELQDLKDYVSKNF